VAAGRAEGRVRPPRPAGRRWARACLAAAAAALLLGGCAHYNTFYNASKSFREAEQDRDKAIKAGQSGTEPTPNAKKGYEAAITKCQKILDDYPGSGMTDDALFLMGKSYYRLQSYRMSIAKLDLLFANFPATQYEEEALFLQALDHLFIHDVAGSTKYIETLQSKYPQSRYQSQTLRMRAENSFSLREWAEARDAYAQYLDRYPKAEDAVDAAYKLGQSLFELKAYPEAVERLQPIVSDTEHRDIAFNARLLRARALTRVGKYEEADREIAALKPIAEANKARGDVAIAEVENLMAQGKADGAAPLLENMPDEWRTPVVSARAADLLGRSYLQQWKLEDAGKQLRDALRNATALDDADASRDLSNSVQQYLAAEQALTGAKGDRVAGLKLTEANALLFGLGRPRRALELYLEISGSSDADSATVARALYGSALIYRDRLSQPDSAGQLISRLEESYPASAQAFVARTGKDGNLFDYLKEQRDRLARAKAAADSARGRQGEAAPPGSVVAADTAAAHPAIGVAAGRPAAPAATAPADTTSEPPLPAATGLGRAGPALAPADTSRATLGPAAPAAATPTTPVLSAASADTTHPTAPTGATRPAASADTTRPPAVGGGGTPAPAAPDSSGTHRGGAG
jgi:outer membrane protein assembly factor BamD (BamD/ComL family)